MPEYGEDVTSTTGGSPQTSAATRVGGGNLEFHGYMRAPVRIGYGPHNDLSPGKELHAPPRIPDSSATDWRYIANLPGPWAELYFTYGTSRAQMTVSIAGYNQTATGSHLRAQQVNQAFIVELSRRAPGASGGLKRRPSPS